MFTGPVNIINVPDVERELARYAAKAVHPQVSVWVKSVARNYILGKLAAKDVQSNFREYTERGKRNPLMPVRVALPDWAKEALKHGEKLHWFDPAQPRRRVLWQTLNMIVLWFNTFAPNDTRLRRCDRINFDTAAKAGALWFKDVTENVWLYIKDKPPVIVTYERGYHWVRMTTALNFEREGRLMGHCVGNGTYYECWRDGVSEFYSLRDTNNEPHATLQVDKNKLIQCKGKQNRRPDDRYQPYIRRFVADMRWTVCGDTQNID